PGRDVQITGEFSQGEAKQLALVLRYGSLPVQFDRHLQTIESVSPTLGKDQLSAGIVSGLIGLGLVALYMILYYRLLGLVVVVGLGLTGMLFFSVISYLSSSHGLTLTLAGVTGIIVSVGVTVDSYVVYFERTNFQFIKHSRRWAILSGTLLLLSVVLLFTRGLEFGIDFEGGTSWQVRMASGHSAKVAEVRDLLRPLGYANAKVSILSGA